MTPALYLQRDQPDGVPPLSLTGERTLPDVPEENYWFRRHLVVYEWIAEQVRGMRVIDMACGEGYGADVLARTAASVVGVDANPEAHEHSRLRYVRANLRFARDLVDSFREPADAVVFLQTIEHLQQPAAVLEHFRSLIEDAPSGGRGGVPAGQEGAAAGRGGPAGQGGVAAGQGGAAAGRGIVFVSTPNVLTLAPKGSARSDNPWHVHEYRAAEFAQLCRSCFATVELYGLFHARKLRAHELALRLGWDRVHPRLGLTGRFYGRFTPAIACRDFALRAEGEADMDRALDLIAVCRA